MELVTEQDLDKLFSPYSSVVLDRVFRKAVSQFSSVTTKKSLNLTNFNTQQSACLRTWQGVVLDSGIISG
jgi:hypothetical protein